MGENVKVFLGDDGLYGICDESGRGLIYESEFCEETANAIARMMNSDNPPMDWEETAARLERAGLTFLR